MKLITDRTTITTDDECGKKRFLYRDWDGTGLVPTKEASFYLEGRRYHLDMAALVEGTPLSEVIEAIEWPSNEDFSLQEPVARRIGMATAFDHFIKPSLLEGKRVVAVEKEMILDRSPLWIAFTDDVVLERLNDGLLEVYDYKGFGMLGKGWFDHWNYSIQLHINIAGTQEEFRRPVAFAQIIGWQKGRDEGGKLRHPYVWAYWGEKKGWTPDYAWGLELRPIWEMNEADPKKAIQDWVLSLGAEVAINLFPFSAKVGLDERILATVVKERTARELAIREGVAPFEHRFERCRPSFGPACAFLEMCHNASIEEAPLESGLFVRRTPHHEVEVVGRDEE